MGNGVSTPGAKYTGGMWIGMAVLASCLLAVCALMAGLILAVSGVDVVWLNTYLETGPGPLRMQAREVAKIKRRSSWMLCSLIIISVVCGESLPIIVERLHGWTAEWQPIIVSTLLMLFLAELLPQYMIPKHAMQSVYYCRYCIWGAMLLTSPVSYSIAWLLDYFAGNNEKWPVFNIEQLKYLLWYHERSQKKGGMLSEDTIRIAVGALQLDSQRINGDPMSVNYLAPCETDVEKLGSSPSPGIIIKWNDINYVDIDEAINESLMQRIKKWSMTHVPVIAKETSPTSIAGRSYGLLHIQDLLGVPLDGSWRVKDFPLYSLPIVHDTMPVYDLLNMFQLEMSSMAIVVASPVENHFAYTNVSLETKVDDTDWPQDFLRDAACREKHPQQLGKNLSGVRIVSPVGIATYKNLIDVLLQKRTSNKRRCMTQLDGTSLTVSQLPGVARPSDIIVPGERRIAYQLGVAAVSEKLGEELGSPTGSRIDIAAELDAMEKKKANRGENIKETPYDSEPGAILRRRIVSLTKENPWNLDGANERNSTDTDTHVLHVKKVRATMGDSSYTDNSAGGFHHAGTSELVEHAYLSPYFNRESQVSAGSIPPHTSSDDILRSIRYGSAVTMSSPSNPSRHISLPPLPTSTTAGRDPQISPSQGECSQRFKGNDQQGDRTSDLVMPLASTSIFNTNDLRARFKSDFVRAAINTFADFRSKDISESSLDSDGDSVSLDSYYDDAAGLEGINSRIYDAIPFSAAVCNEQSGGVKHVPSVKDSKKTTTVAERTYGGFAAGLLDKVVDKENRIQKYKSKTLPRGLRQDQKHHEALGDRTNSDTPLREHSFHDDRALLPSQRRIVNKSLHNGETGTTRSSSLWI